MWAFARLAPVSVASVAAMGLIAPVVVAPPAAAAPCAQAASAAPASSVSGAAGGGDAAGRTRADRAHAPRRTEPGNAVRTGSAPSRGLRPDSDGCSELRADATARGGAALCPRPPGAAAQQVPQPHRPDDRGPCRGDCGPDDNDRQLGGWTQQPEQHIRTLRHLGRRSRDYVGQRPNRRERPGAHGIRRHVRRLQRR